VDDASAALVNLGFEPRGELGIPDRWAFWEPDRLMGTNTYVVVAGSLALRNHIAVRDALRADPDLRAEYGSSTQRRCAASTGIWISGGFVCGPSGGGPVLVAGSGGYGNSGTFGCSQTDAQAGYVEILPY
jgi:hypothetical protein